LTGVSKVTLTPTATVVTIETSGYTIKKLDSGWGLSVSPG
jgi:hypothetical protein